MDILLSRDTAKRLMEALQAQGQEAVRLKGLRDGTWQLAFDRVQPGDYAGEVAGVPFAVDPATAEDVERVMVAWVNGEFVAGPILDHDCGMDAEIRE